MKISEQKRKWFNEQMEYLIVDKQMTKSDIARELGILPQSLNNIVNGPRGLSDKFIDDFAETFSISNLVLDLPKAGGKDAEETADYKMRTIASQQETIARLVNMMERLTEGEKKNQDARTA